MFIKDKPINERPRERALSVGIENISNEDLLAIIIKTGTKDNSVNDIALNILKRLNSLNDLNNIKLQSFLDIKGLGKIKALELMASIELGKRVFLKQSISIPEKYNDSKTIYFYNKYLFVGKMQEYFYCLYLDNKNKLIERKLLFMGTINRSVVHPREIFKEAYLLSASSIVCLHNHPSGELAPSKEDILLTKSLVEIGRLQGINVIDHLIVSDKAYYSFFDEGQIE